jgi:hypothetical protein
MFVEYRLTADDLVSVARFEEGIGHTTAPKAPHLEGQPRVAMLIGLADENGVAPVLVFLQPGDQGLVHCHESGAPMMFRSHKIEPLPFTVAAAAADADADAPSDAQAESVFLPISDGSPAKEPEVTVTRVPDPEPVTDKTRSDKKKRD